ncbi:unnamed protein product, partial [Rotaria magnacalcarata]
LFAIINLMMILGARPGTLQDFCLESQRLVPTPFMFGRQAQSAKYR